MKEPSLRDGVKRHAMELHGAWVATQIAQGFEQVDTPSSLAAVDETWALGYQSQKLGREVVALSRAQKIDKGIFCHLLMFLANSSAGLKLPEQSTYTFVLTYAFDKRIEERNRLGLLPHRPGTLLLSDGAASFKDLCYTIAWGRARSQQGGETRTQPTGDVVNLPADNDIDDTYSICNSWSDLVAVMCRGDMLPGLLPRHFKKGVGPPTQEVFQGPSPELVSYFEQGLVEMRKVQAATSGTPSKKREYNELHASPDVAEKKLKQAMRVVEALTEKHASLSFTRQALVWRE
jgi:hypothetical protein